MPETRLDWKMEPKIYPEEILFLYILWNVFFPIFPKKYIYLLQW